jgi:hypothetical protein
MKNEDREFCDTALDFLADGLRTKRLEGQHKEKYFESFRKFGKEQFQNASKILYDTYHPRRLDDFPVVSVWLGVLDQEPKQDIKFWDCICCGVKFPAAMLNHMNCLCDKLICYECDKCEEHCKCLLGITPLNKSRFWAKEILPQLREYGIGQAILRTVQNQVSEAI